MKGAIENCCRAEQEIMKKVREAYENDVAAMSVSERHLLHVLLELSLGLGDSSELHPKLLLHPSLTSVRVAAGRVTSTALQNHFYLKIYLFYVCACFACVST